MAPQKRKAESYDTSDPFVAGDSDTNDTTTVSSSKRTKTKSSTTNITKPKTSSSSNTTEIPTLKTDSDGTKYWELSRARRVTLSAFKGKTMVSIREYYEKDGSWLPGKKGITMTLDQFSSLIMVLPQIEEVLSGKGEEIPRPDYDDGGHKNGGVGNGGGDEDEDDEEEEDRKANIDATSDEDD